VIFEGLRVFGVAFAFAPAVIVSTGTTKARNSRNSTKKPFFLGTKSNGVSDCLQALGPALAAMEHRDDLQTLAAHSVRNDD
jgi:hypothetical protein